MRRCSGIGALAAALVLWPTVSAAQTDAYVGGGITLPDGDYGEYSDNGWMALAGLRFDVGDRGLWLALEGFLGRNDHSDLEGDRTYPLGGMARLGYGLGAIYLFGGGGVLVHRYSSDDFGNESDSSFGYQAGAGVDFPIGDGGGPAVFVEGRWVGADDTTFLGVMAGVSFTIGGGRM